MTSWLKRHQRGVIATYTAACIMTLRDTVSTVIGRRIQVCQDGFDIYDGELGLLLDLDEGTLSVYKNGVRLGTMMSGLSGEYVWVMQMIAQANGRPDRQNVRIERAPLPANLSGYDVTDESSHTEDGARKNIASLMKNLKT